MLAVSCLYGGLMSRSKDGRRVPVAAMVLMILVLLWSGSLAFGFAWAAVRGADSMTFGRILTFWVIAVFLGLLALRTSYELGRRLLRRS